MRLLYLHVLTICCSRKVPEETMNSGELKVDVPLAATEESDCEESSDNQQNTPARVSNQATLFANSNPPNLTSTSKSLDPSKNSATVKRASPRFNIDTGGDSVTGSLEDLVSSFDEKITMCFRDYQEKVEKIAPVQVTKTAMSLNATWDFKKYISFISCIV